MTLLHLDLALAAHDLVTCVAGNIGQAVAVAAARELGAVAVLADVAVAKGREVVAAA